MINIKKFDSVAEAVKGVMQKEALKGDQHKIDKNKNNKIDAHDFAILRGEKKPMKKEETEQVDEVNNPFDLKNYKSQLPTKPGEKAGFDSKKTSTGTFYSRKPVKDEPMKKEEVEQVDEGVQQTLRKYVPGYAKRQLNKKMDAQAYAPGDSVKKTVDKDVNYGRYKKIADKLAKEEVEQVDERTLTKGETKEKERIVKGMKKSFKGFKQRYGERAKSVMYATATKAAKNEETITEAKRPESDTVPFITNGDNKPLTHAKDLAKKSLKRLKNEMMGKAGTSE